MLRKTTAAKPSHSKGRYMGASQRNARQLMASATNSPKKHSKTLGRGKKGGP